MPNGTPFFARLKTYFENIALVLQADARAAAMHPNNSDKGAIRERIYADFLRRHAPSRCNVFFGGNLFGSDGSESGQMDVIITCDTTPRYDFQNADGSGKSFAPVDGTVAAVAIKSVLDKKELFDALDGFARIPPVNPALVKFLPNVTIPNYEDWPYKVLYATDGVEVDTLMEHIREYIETHPNVRSFRSPNIIHVLGKYVIVRSIQGLQFQRPDSVEPETIPGGTFFPVWRDADVQPMTVLLGQLQGRANATSAMLFDYSFLISRVISEIRSEPSS